MNRTLYLLGIISLFLQTEVFSEPDKDNKSVTRTLRVVVVANRPLPIFEKKGDKVIEVEPPTSKQPPTAFEFADAAHAPKGESSAFVQTSYRSWPNRLVTISNYKGPSVVTLQFRSLAQNNQQKSLQILADVGDSLSPLLLIHPDRGESGWNKPLVEVIDMDPSKFPSGSVLVVNYSEVPIKFYVVKESKIVMPGMHGVLRAKTQAEESQTITLRYRIDASDGKQQKTLSNSRYKLKKNTRLIVFALPSIGASRAGLPVPNIRMIEDKL
jgi:hypothetical protein